LKTDDNHCGKCSVSCKTGSVCIDGSCDFCAPSFNCSTDTDQCTIEPCVAGIGCTTLDCDNDTNACTVGTCDSLTGCPQLNCSTIDVCTVGPCDPVSGCQPFDCDNTGDPCLSSPCDPTTGCTTFCGSIILSPPNVNFAAQYPDFTTARAIVGSGLKVSATLPIDNVTVTVFPTAADESFAITPTAGLTTSYAGGVFTISGRASQIPYQAALRTLTYTSGLNTGTVTFTFVVSTFLRVNPTTPVSTITIQSGSP